jgi:hypothetical protein
MGAECSTIGCSRVSPEYQANGRNGMTSKKSSKTHESYLSPGVYMEEVSSGARPIQAVGTAVAAFVGLAPVNPKRAVAVLLAVAVVVWAARSRRP